MYSFLEKYQRILFLNNDFSVAAPLDSRMETEEPKISSVRLFSGQVGPDMHAHLAHSERIKSLH